MTAVRLAFTRFNSFIERKDYILSSLYCSSDTGDIKFIELRTPKKQKSFIVYIPDKYALRIDPKESEKRPIKYLSEVEEGLSSRQIRYLADLKGTLSEWELVAISSSELCWYRDSTDKGLRLYDISDTRETSETSEDEERPEEPPEDTFEDDNEEVSKLEKQALSIQKRIEGDSPEKENVKERSDVKEKPTSKKLKEKSKEPEEKPSSKEPETTPLKESKDKPTSKESKIPPKESEKSSKEPKKTPESTLKEPETSKEKSTSEESEDQTPPQSESDEDVEVELVFEDGDGEPVDDVSEFIQSDLDPEDYQESEDLESLENMDEPMEYSDIILGMIYPSVTLPVFFKKAKEADIYEKEVVSACEQIDENILEIRKTKLKEVKDLTETFVKHAEERFEKINKEETSLRSSLNRLSVIRLQAEALRKKVLNNPKLKEETPDIDNLWNQVRKNIHETNIELLRLQDTADELISNYQSSIKELMEL